MDLSMIGCINKCDHFQFLIQSFRFEKTFHQSPQNLTGAQLAGMQQHTIAASFVDSINKQGASGGRQFRGVVFFASQTGEQPAIIQKEGWYVMDLQKHITLKSHSPIKEMDAFVLFDEARCR